MKLRLQLACFLKAALIVSMLSASVLAWADAQTYKNEASSTINYKGEASAPTRKLYKGEVETNAYAANYVPQEGKYGGQVYTSDLYQGPIKGPGYSPAGTRDLHEGFYVGLEAGYDSYKMRSNINIIQSGVSVLQQNPDLDAVGLSYSFVGGYGWVFDNPLYLGAEIFYNYSRANTSQNIGIFNGSKGIYYIETEILNSYGLSLLPGIKLGASTLLYLKGGYTRVEAQTYETSGSLGINNAQSSGANGVHYGLGIEAAVYKNWSVRGEYTHVNCENFTTRVGTRITPSNNQFMFGVIFHLT